MNISVLYWLSLQGRYHFRQHFRIKLDMLVTFLDLIVNVFHFSISKFVLGNGIYLQLNEPLEWDPVKTRTASPECGKDLVRHESEYTA